MIRGYVIILIIFETSRLSCRARSTRQRRPTIHRPDSLSAPGVVGVHPLLEFCTESGRWAVRISGRIGQTPGRITLALPGAEGNIEVTRSPALKKGAPALTFDPPYGSFE